MPLKLCLLARHPTDVPCPHAHSPPKQVQFVGQCLMLAGSAVLKSLLQPGCMARLAGAHMSQALHSPRGTAADGDCLLDCFGRCVALALQAEGVH